MAYDQMLRAVLPKLGQGSLVQMTARAFSQIWKSATAKVHKARESWKKRHNLALMDVHAPFLAQFERFSNFGDAIEVPGQYTGVEKPQPERHAKIVNFSARVRTIGSKQKPKQITVFGDDEKEYNFLVKEARTFG